MKKKSLPEELIAYLKRGCTYFALPKFSLAVIKAPDNFAAFDSTSDHKEPILYKVGSLTKLVTGLIILQLCEEGLLQLHDKVAMHLQWFNTNVHIVLTEDITIVDLLLHTSGLPRGTLFRKNPSFAEVIKSLPDAEKKHCNTCQFKYSNLGYIILGYIIEAVTKLDYCSVVKSRIFDPLGMSKSGFGIKNLSAQISKPHGLNYFSPKNKTAHDYNAIPLLQAPYASFDMHSSLCDFSTLINCILNDGWHNGKHLFSANSIKKLFDINRPINKQLTSTIGLMSLKAFNTTVYFQNAEHWGHSASLMIIPEKKTALIALTNRGSAGLDLWRILQNSARYLIQDQDERCLNFNYTDPKSLVGNYNSAALPEIVISAKRHELYMNCGNEEASLLIYKGRYVFTQLKGTYSKYVITIDFKDNCINGLYIGPHYYHKNSSNTVIHYRENYKPVTGIYINKAAGKISLFERKGNLILAYSPLKEAVLTQTKKDVFTQLTGPFINEPVHINADKCELTLSALTFKKLKNFTY